jgi:signal transduction histidine kinase/ActR/RegA family two-component response regulator
MANLIGWIMSVEIERRERALFWSSRQLAEAKRALEEMARNAAEASAARTRVLAAVSHDLRQPLASLSLYAGLLRTRNDALEPAGLAGTVERLDACVSALSGNLDRLSELGGLRALESPLPVERIDLRRLLGRIDSVYSAEAARRGVRLVVRVPRPGRQFAVSNENRLWDVLSNLVGNAMKFSATERAPWVLIRVRRAGAKLVIEVRDNGIGIAPADQRRVFDEYFQVANHARNPEHGYGMGLSIVRETVSRLPDHAIGLVSQPGRGTRVAVTLPAADALASTEALTNPVVAAAQTSWPSAADVRRVEGAAQRSEGARHCESPQAVYRVGSGADTESIQANAVRTDEGCAAPIEPLQGAYVLFIEDDASMRDALGRMLEHWGALVETAASGEEALQISVDAERSFDAIVSDFRLPGAWDGLRLIEELRTREGLRTPAIVLSGEFSVEKLRRGAPDDVRVMAKPPDLAVLREFLEASARGAHQLRA